MGVARFPSPFRARFRHRDHGAGLLALVVAAPVCTDDPAAGTPPDGILVVDGDAQAAIQTSPGGTEPEYPCADDGNVGGLHCHLPESP